MKINFWFILFSLVILLVFFILHETFRQVKVSQNKTVILCAGDSLTKGGYPEKLKLLFLQNGYRGIVVVNLGRGGHTSGEYGHFLQKNNSWQKPFPDWVLIQLGTNDVRIDSDHTSGQDFEKNMEKIIEFFKKEAVQRNRNINIVLATIPPVVASRNFDQTSIKRVTQEINPIIKNLAKQHNLFLVDNYQLFIKNSKELPEIHPTSKGYQLMAENWFQLLKTKIK